MKLFKTLTIRALSDIKRSAAPRVLYLIKHSCSCFKQYLTIASQQDIAPVIRGNVGGHYEKTKWYKVSDEPVKKQRKDESK